MTRAARREALRAGAVAAAAILAAAPAARAQPPAAAEPLPFVTHTIATELAGAYQAVAADLNADARPDVIALSTRLPELVWYENPGWERHVIADGLTRMINVAAHDIDGDGIPELALAHDFSSTYADSVGIVSLLTHRGDPRETWSMREIDRVPTTHRLRWADADGSGAKVLVSAPLIGDESLRPEFHDTLSLLWYRPDDWERRTMTDAERGVVHGIGVGPWDDPGRDAVLSASFLGVHVHELADGGWTRTHVTAGDPSDWPASGASEAQAGRLGGERFVATIEPWHGHQVVVYRQASGSGAWSRHVLDPSIEDGHTVVVGDLDGDGRDEIVAGERRGRQSLYLYRMGAGDAGWSRQVLDDGDMGAGGCAIADLNLDDRPDVVCAGSRTANLKWYENAGRREPAR